MEQKNKKFFVWILSLVIVGMILGIGGVSYFFIMLFSHASDSSETPMFSITEGQGVNAISRNLYHAGLIQSKLVFETYIWLIDAEDRIIAGTYNVSLDITMIGLAKKLLMGPPKPKDRAITIIEGWTLNDIASYLEDEGIGSKDEFFKLVRAPFPESLVSEFSFLGDIPRGMDMEGYLFPDTYRIFLDATVSDVLGKMLDNFEAKMDQGVLEEIRRQGRTMHEVITLASIVEAEVKDEFDRKKVADIFFKRLRVGMLLQSDATINYITQSGRSRSTYDDLEIDSPYNTYKYPGFPPGPINNPSLSAILAVLYPETNPYYYFLTDAQGNVHYARTAEEHGVNRGKYLN